MDISFVEQFSLFEILVIGVLTTLTSLAAFWGKAVFHDGIRPIMPEYLEGRMKRPELASISFGLSIGFIVSMGLAFAISFQLLNPWLLFLPTDILGVIATRWWIAGILGAGWGLLSIFGLTAIQVAFTALPIDLLGALGELTIPVLVAFTAFPILAILYQFGWVKALITGVIVLISRQILPIFGGTFIDKGNNYLEQAAQLAGVTLSTDMEFQEQLASLHLTTSSNPQVEQLLTQAAYNNTLGTTISGFTMQIAVLMLMGMIFLVGFAINKDIRNKANGQASAEMAAMAEKEANIFDERTKRLYKGLPLLASIGALIAVALNIGIFTGSEVAGPILQQAWEASGAERQSLLQTAAIIDIIRTLSFIPLIATTALATGVYGVVGLTFIFPIGYLMPNPVIAAVAGAVVISLEVFALRAIGRYLSRYPSLREVSDNIRTAMTSMIEIALFIGGALAALQLAPEAFGLALTIYVVLYAANEGLGRPVMRLAAGPVAIIITGIVMNLLYFVNLI